MRLENGQYNPSLKLAIDISKGFGAAVEDVFLLKMNSVIHINEKEINDR